METEESYNKANNQTTYVEALGREYKEFRLIEILNENEVEDIASFIHPIYPGQIQNLYFDIQGKYMLEKLQHPRVFIYTKEKS
jgi:hypothetical protein